jgi:hypothetical protein
MKSKMLAVLIQIREALPPSVALGEVVRKLNALAEAINNKLTST